MVRCSRTGLLSSQTCHGDCTCFTSSKLSHTLHSRDGCMLWWSGAVLMKNTHPIAYLSKALTQKIYEKEFLAIILAIDKWRPYLIHNQFTIRTDHHSLKYLLKQRISTPLQHKYLTKLLGYDYKIEYKKGLENKVADALSRRDHSDAIYCALTEVKPA